MIKSIVVYSFRIYYFINRWITTKINKLRLKANSVELGDSVMINGILHIVNKGEIKIGNGVKINSSLRYNPISHHPCYLRI